MNVIPPTSLDRHQNDERPKLGKSDGFFRLLVDAVEDYAIFALDVGGRILTWNLGAELLKGYKSDEVIGSHFSRFYTKEDIDRDHPAHELQLAAENGKYEEEGWRVRKNGEHFWANVIITALRGDDGQLRGFGKVTRDLTTKKMAENALRESEETFRLMVTSVTDYAIMMLNPAGHITSWNAGAERIKGYRPAEILGKHFSIFYPASEIENSKPEMELRIAADEGRYEEEGWRIRKDGTMFWANVTITALRGEGTTEEIGPLRGFAKVTRDLTSRRQAEEALRQSQERYRMLVDNVTDYALILLDPVGRVTSWNSGATRITGYQSKEILGSHFSKFYSRDDVAAGKPVIELRTASETGRFEEVALRTRKDGSQYWANVVLTAIRDEVGKILGFSKVTRDLTERKKAEDELRQAYAELETRVERRTSELFEAKANAEAAVIARDRFFSIASHELKTPISSLKLQAQIRRRCVEKGDFSDFAPDRLAELCEDDEKQVARLVFLVDNMLDISRLTSGAFELTLETVDLVETVEDVARRLEPILKDSGNSWTLTRDLRVVGDFDRHRIEQVLTNLLSNAAKYAPGTPVAIGLTLENDQAVLTVRDRGNGIAAADHLRIFEPFERVKGASDAKGLGLGLYIVKQIVEAHRGTIRLISTPGDGTLFIVTLPVRRAAAAKGAF